MTQIQKIYTVTIVNQSLKQANILSFQKSVLLIQHHCPLLLTLVQKIYTVTIVNQSHSIFSVIGSADSTTLSAASNSSTKDIYSYHSESELEVS